MIEINKENLFNKIKVKYVPEDQDEIELEILPINIKKGFYNESLSDYASQTEGWKEQEYNDSEKVLVSTDHYIVGEQYPEKEIEIITPEFVNFTMSLIQQVENLELKITEMELKMETLNSLEKPIAETALTMPKVQESIKSFLLENLGNLMYGFKVNAAQSDVMVTFLTLNKIEYNSETVTKTIDSKDITIMTPVASVPLNSPLYGYLTNLKKIHETDMVGAIGKMFDNFRKKIEEKDKLIRGMNTQDTNSSSALNSLDSSVYDSYSLLAVRQAMIELKEELPTEAQIHCTSVINIIEKYIETISQESNSSQTLLTESIIKKLMGDANSQNAITSEQIVNNTNNLEVQKNLSFQE